MIIEQIVEIPADHRIIFELPPEIPAGTIARLELIYSPYKEALNDTVQQRTTKNRTSLSQYFNLLSPETYGDGVVYQRNLRNEWDA